MSYDLDHALVSNNLGTRLVELNRLSEAESHFKHALKELLKKKTDKVTDPTLQTSKPVVRYWSSSPQVEQQYVFVYSRALVLDTKYNHKHQAIYVCCIAYNLALTYQLTALQTNKACYAQKASLLYEISMKALQDAQGPRRSGYLDALKVVIFNNAGTIYYDHFSNVSAATQCFQAVCGMITELHVSSQPVALEDEEVRWMITNMFVRFEGTAPAA
jgi:hypothetical protein